MKLIYNISLYIYYILIKLASLFNEKARMWVKGRKNLFIKIRAEIGKGENIAWFHCASLGEFEQGRPVIEQMKSQNKDLKILLTFFSPSGYEMRKNYDKADYIYYIPFDFAKNAKKFIEIINPVFAVFIKYEFWYNYLKTLHQNNIPVYLASGIFRKEQAFFKWYGKWYRKLLNYFTCFFVQNEQSLELLNSIGIKNVVITGDTRFDRVKEIVKIQQSVAEIESFLSEIPVIIAGSTWERDEELLINYVNKSEKKFKTIIAPHEISVRKIEMLKTKIKKKTILYSEIKGKNLKDFDVLIINQIGLLSIIYRYGSIAYIGGGFGAGIHNILEATAFGLAVIFGPNYKKFKEAVELINYQSAFSISDYEELKEKFDYFLDHEKALKQTSKISSGYVIKNAGATSKIIAIITENTALLNS